MHAGLLLIVSSLDLCLIGMKLIEPIYITDDVILRNRVTLSLILYLLWTKLIAAHASFLVHNDLIDRRIRNQIVWIVIVANLNLHTPGIIFME